MRALNDAVAMAKACGKAADMTDRGNRRPICFDPDNVFLLARIAFRLNLDLTRSAR